MLTRQNQQQDTTGMLTKGISPPQSKDLVCACGDRFKDKPKVVVAGEGNWCILCNQTIPEGTENVVGVRNVRIHTILVYLNIMEN